MPPQDDDYGLTPAKPTAAVKDDEYGLQPATSSESQEPEKPSLYQRLTTPENTGISEEFQQKHPYIAPVARFLSSTGAAAMQTPEMIGTSIMHPFETLKGMGQSVADAAKFWTGQSEMGTPTWEGVKGVLPEALGTGAGQVAGGEIAGKLTPPLMKAAAKGGEATARALGKPLTIGMTGEEMLTKGVKPSARATGWTDAVARPGVQRALKEYQAANPDEMSNIHDIAESFPDIKNQLWKDKIEPALQRQGPLPLEMKKVAENVRRAITPEMREFEPANAADLEKFASQLEGYRDIAGGNRLLTWLNGKLDTYFAKYPAARYSALIKNPEIAGWEAAREALRGEILDSMERSGETQIRDARLDYGALKTIEKEMQKKGNVADRKNPMGLYNFLSTMFGASVGAHAGGALGGPVGAALGYGAGKLMEHLNDRNVLARRGIAKFNPPEEAPFTPPPAYQRPSVAGLLPEEATAVPRQLEMPGAAELAHPEKFVKEPIGRTPEKTSMREPETQRFGTQFLGTSKPLEIGHTAEGGPIRETTPSIKKSRQAAGPPSIKEPIGPTQEFMERWGEPAARRIEEQREEAKDWRESEEARVKGFRDLGRKAPEEGEPFGGEGRTLELEPEAKTKWEKIKDEFSRLANEEEGSLKIPGSAVDLFNKALSLKEKPTVKEFVAAMTNRNKAEGLKPILAADKPEVALDRAMKIGEDELDFQRGRPNSGEEWYNEDIQKYDDALRAHHAALKDPSKLTIAKAIQSGMSLGNQSIPAVNNALDGIDAWQKTGKIPLKNPATGKFWPNGKFNVYTHSFKALQRLIDDKGETGAAKFLMEQHPTSELKKYRPTVKGAADVMQHGGMILGDKAGPFFLNMMGIGEKLTTDMWWFRTWNRWMNTPFQDILKDGKKTTEVMEQPRAGERPVMENFADRLAKKKGLEMKQVQAILWNYEQALYKLHGFLTAEQPSYGQIAKTLVEERVRRGNAQSSAGARGAGENANAGGSTGNVPRGGGEQKTVRAPFKKPTRLAAQ